MPSRRRLLLALAPIAALLCVAVPAASHARAQAAPQPPADAVEATVNADGQTILIGEGQPLLVRLSADDDWTVTVDDETILQPATPADGLPDGVQAEFSALAPGTTTLRATGAPRCAPNQVCPLIARLFTATVRVLPAGTVVIGPDAANGTVTIAQGDTLIVQLGVGFDWSFSYTPDGVLAPVDLTVGLGPAVQQVLLAQQTGTVEVQATGTPHCDPDQPCVTLAAVFATTIVVQ